MPIAYALTATLVLALFVSFSAALTDAVRDRAAHTAACNILPSLSAQTRLSCAGGAN
ncbi:hypothetical protein [uncultured Roseobacter sp.]|uniref:hypothetical protein n=1 Tax=uncultured Roseobacter sp. TaxID=114847 RepID=UPI002623ACAA|nr:hypothetical protein [uncultured Roseobacter sp.]